MFFEGLLHSLRRRIVVDEEFKNGEDMPTIKDHAVEQLAQLRLAGRFLIPLRQYGRGDFYIAPQFFRGVAAQKQAVKKGCFALGELEIPQDVFYRVGRRGHGENAVYRFRRHRQEAACVRESN